MIEDRFEELKRGRCTEAVTSKCHAAGPVKIEARSEDWLRVRGSIGGEIVRLRAGVQLEESVVEQTHLPAANLQHVVALAIRDILNAFRPDLLVRNCSGWAV